MKKQISITQVTVAADNPVALHQGNSNDRPIAGASSSVNSSNYVFETLYQPYQTYYFPKRLFGKRLDSIANKDSERSLYNFLRYTWSLKAIKHR